VHALLDEVAPQVHSPEVLVQNVLALLGQLGFPNELVHVLHVQAEQAGDGAHGHHVLG
jgi:hypothetical protein